MKKKWLIIIPLGILLIAGSIFIIYTKNQPITQPLIPPEEEVELVEEEEDTEAVTEDVAEEEEETIGNRISQAIQGTINRLFNREVNIAAIGDSLTRGVGDATKGGGYVGILERSINFEEELAIFENFGKPGNRSDQLLKRLEEEVIQDGLADADLILITIGANDIMQVAKENITNLEIDDFIDERKEYEQRLAEILGAIQELNRNAEIYLLGIYNPFEKYFQDIAELNMIVEAWNDTGNTMAQATENVTFIPVEDLFTGNNDDIFAADNFHPNYNGYYLIAGRVLEYISNEEG